MTAIADPWPELPIFYGGDYTPEQWPPEVWKHDVELMQEAGVNLVTLGVFAWSWLEPQPGVYRFEPLDQVLDLLHQEGIRVCLGTGTAAPPPWLAHLHPEILPVTREGVRLEIGSRQHFNPLSPAYQEAAERLVQALATHVQGHPALTLWHVSNEIGCHVFEDFSETSARAFRRWLKGQYGSLKALNEAWGTMFWSQQYTDWEEIQPPRAMPTFPNPSQLLDWRRFWNQALLESYLRERDILRAIDPKTPVTTNFFGLHRPIDAWSWAPELDLIAHDSYPDPASPSAAAEAALQADFMRSLRSQPWILMEQAPGRVQWRAENRLKPPGVMRLWSLQAVARGARGVMFFQWRASRQGAEKFHSAMVGHVGAQGRTWSEVQGLGRELRRLGRLEARVEAQIAILFDWENWWALEQEAHPSQRLNALDQLRAHYIPLWEHNLTVDFAHPSADLSAYRLVIAPNLYLTRKSWSSNLEGYVAAGGHLLISCFSGIVDEHDQIWLGGYPGPLRSLLGVWIDEFEVLPPGIQRVAGEGGTWACDLWADLIHLEGAQSVWRYTEGYSRGLPALTVHRFGQGQAWYLGTRPEPQGMSWLLRRLADGAGVEPIAPPGLEAIRLKDPSGPVLVLLNHGEDLIHLPLEEPMVDLLSGQPYSGICSLGGREARWLRASRNPRGKGVS